MNISHSEPLWLSLQDILDIHEEQIILFGGPEGVRDEGLLEGALARPQNLFHIEGQEDVLILAIRLGVGIAKNHAFVDGNKRTGAAAMIEFLAVNGYDLIMRNNGELGRLFEAAVAGDISEEKLAEDLSDSVHAWV